MRLSLTTSLETGFFELAEVKGCQKGLPTQDLRSQGPLRSNQVRQNLLIFLLTPSVPPSVEK